MFRRQLIPLLLDHAMSVPEIARSTGELPATVALDLRHLLRSLKHTEYLATVTPAECRKCGFEFNPDKLRKPSKCPKCHGTWINEPRIALSVRPLDQG